MQSVPERHHIVSPVSNPGDTYATADELHARAVQLLTAYQEAGGHTLDGHIPSAEERRLKGELRALYADLRHCMDNGTARDYVLLLPLANICSIDIYGQQIDFATRYDGFCRAADLWAKGDRSIDAEDLIELLQPLQRVNRRAIDPKYNAWSAGVIDKWIRDLERPRRAAQSGTVQSGTVQTGTAQTETAQTERRRRRIALLQREDLRAYYPSGAKPLISHLPAYCAGNPKPYSTTTQRPQVTLTMTCHSDMAGK